MTAQETKNEETKETNARETSEPEHVHDDDLLDVGKTDRKMIIRRLGKLSNYLEELGTKVRHEEEVRLTRILIKQLEKKWHM